MKEHFPWEEEYIQNMENSDKARTLLMFVFCITLALASVMMVWT